jgi:hypothetical protein
VAEALRRRANLRLAEAEAIVDRRTIKNYINGMRNYARGARPLKINNAPPG